jgi:L-ascorbate metabolism protein UlaG (beta-lactamase superfamily)
MTSPQELATRIGQAKAAYPSIWKKVIAEWKSTDAGDCAWLTHSANYLLNTAGVRWALDPLALPARLPGMTPPNYAGDLDQLQLIVLSHAHHDHLDLDLVKALQGQPLFWVIPDFMLDTLMQSVSIPLERVIVPEPGSRICIEGLTLTPFEGLHMRGDNGIAEMGYLAEFNGLRWLFPVDTRLFDIQRLPDFGRLEGVFAHLWLGKAGAQVDPPPMLEEFCAFFGAFNAGRLVITHLNEYGRDVTELWDETHYRSVVQCLKRDPDCPQLEMGRAGDRINLGSLP